MPDRPAASTPLSLAESSQWRPLRLLLDAMDRDIAMLYVSHGLTELRPRYTGPLIVLARREPATIQELADAVEVTHSAMSQTVAAMRKAGLVDRAQGSDARTRRVQLTARARSMVPFLEAEWRATEAAVIELEEEIPRALSQVVRDIEQALERRPFRDRLDEALAVTLAEAHDR